MYLLLLECLFVCVCFIVSGLYQFLESFYISSLLCIQSASIFPHPELPFRLAISFAFRFDVVLFVHSYFSCLNFLVSHPKLLEKEVPGIRTEDSPAHSHPSTSFQHPQSTRQTLECSQRLEQTAAFSGSLELSTR